jgi:predicted ATPase/class 3 adenylate cyclase
LRRFPVTDLPTGTVTFLFTDVEGSTRLLHELGDRYAEVLSEHRRVLRNAFARHRGVEVDTQGDAFFVAFAKASAALAAAAEGRDALAAGPIHVRMGLHTGEPLVTDEGYVGLDVHRAARIAAAGHGGQILVSQATRQLVRADSLRDLGDHRLKDLTAPERIYQLGDGDFPPLKSLNATNLPVASNPLVGRELELAELTAMLRDGTRLITLTGAGGSGKTRLGLQVAAEVSDHFVGGVFFVPLAEVDKPDLVEGTIASVIGLRDLADVSERHALIVLDNFEHVLDAAPVIARLLSAGPAVKVIATSRAPLRVASEQEFPVEPLPAGDAVELLTQRARAVRPDFQPSAAAREICRRLDGLPLALELAAARLRSLDADALLARLQEALPLLTAGRRDVPARHRTLRATIEWSYDLLTPNLRDVFARLAAFAGTFTLESAETVADAPFDALDGLVEASLLKPIGGNRFLMLETIREFAVERLAQLPVASDIGRRHAEHYLDVARSSNLSEESQGLLPQHDLAVAELANFRKALAWAADAAEPELGLRLMLALQQFWVARDPFEARRWLGRLLAVGGDVDPTVHAGALLMYGGMVFIVGEFERGVEIFEESLAEYRALDDELGVATVLTRLVVPAMLRKDFDEARALAKQSLEVHRSFENTHGEAIALGTLANVEWESGRGELAVRLAQESLELATQVGFDWWRVGILYSMCEWAIARADLAEAERRGREALELAHRIGARQYRVYSLALLARCAAETGRLRRAGLLWSAVGLDERQGPIGQWEDERETYAAAVLSHADDAFEDGVAEGGQKELDELVLLALDDLD